MKYNDPKVKKSGFRGYIFSRKIDGSFIPHRVQNLVPRITVKGRTYFSNLVLQSTR